GRTLRGHQGSLAQGDLAPRSAGSRARGHPPLARAVPLEPREDRQDAQDQLPRAPLQDQGHGPQAGRGRQLGGTRVPEEDLDMALKWLVVSVALLTGLMLVSDAGAQQAAVKSAPRNTLNAPAMGVPVASDYIIGPEDMLQVSIWKNEAMSRTLPVRPDGKISLPLLHDITAAGLTPLQLRDKIAAA